MEIVAGQTISQNYVPFLRSLGHAKLLFPCGITTKSQDLVRSLSSEVAKEIKTVSIPEKSARKSVK